MTDLTTTTEQRTQLQPSGKVRQALDLMIWQGIHRDEAAKAAGMLPKSLYNAFRKHHVKAYYLAQLDVLRTSARARSFHRLEAIAQQDDNRMAAVNAIKTMEQISENAPAASSMRQQTPGVVIVIGDRQLAARPAPGVTIDMPRDRDTAGGSDEKPALID